MKLLGLLILLAISLPAPVRPAETGQSAQGDERHVVSGTLEELDLERMKGMIKTDMGKPIFFEVTKPELFKSLHVGDHVTVQLDDRGRANKVIDTPVPELTRPPLSTP